MEESVLSRFGLPALGAVLCFGAAIVAWNSTQEVPDSVKKRSRARSTQIVEANWDVEDQASFVPASERELLDTQERARVEQHAKKFGSGSLLDAADKARTKTAIAVPDGSNAGVWKVE